MKRKIKSPIDVKRPKTVMKRVRRTESPKTALKNIAAQNERFAAQVSELEAKRQELLDTLTDLNKRTVEDGDLIVGLRERFQALLSKKQLPDVKNKYKEEDNTVPEDIEQIINDFGKNSITSYLDSHPIIIEDLYNNTNTFSRLADYIPDNYFNEYLYTSLEQINSLSKCIMYFNQLKECIQSPSFRSKAELFAKNVINTREATLLVYDKVCDEFYTEISRTKYYFPIYEDKSFIAKALYEQKPFVIDSPLDSYLYYPQIDQLLNPGNKAVMTIPIQKCGVLYLCNTNVFKQTFSAFDTYLATFFCDLITPLVDENNKYMEMVHATEHQRALQIFKVNLVSKSNFQELLPFLYETFMECLSALDVEVFIYQKEVFFTFKNDAEGKLVSKEHPFVGLPALVVNSRSSVRYEKVNDEISDYNEEIDKWTYNNSFIGVPVITSSGEIIGVVCLSGKSTANKFTQWDIDFMSWVSQSLSLIIPHCISNLEENGLQNRIDKAAVFPSIISTYTYESMEKKEFFPAVCDDIQRVLACEYVAIFTKNSNTTKMIAQTGDKQMINNELVKAALDEDKSHVTDDFSSIEEFTAVEDVTYSNIAFVSSTIDDISIAVFILNAETSTSKIDQSESQDMINKLKSFILYVIESIKIQNAISAHETTDINTRTIKNVFDVCQTTVAKDMPLLNLLSMVTDLLKMHSFCIFEKRSLKKLYAPYIGSSLVVMGNFVPIDDILLQFIISSDDISIFDNFDDGLYRNSQMITAFKAFKVLIGYSFNKDADYVLVFTGDESATNYKYLIELFTPLISILLKSYITEDKHDILKELNLLNTTDSKIFEVEISSRNFSIAKYNETEKIELLVKIFNTLGINRTLNVDITRLSSFFVMIRSHYKDLPYHNWDHAIDTVQFVFSALTRGKLARVFNEQHIAALILAALMHDIEHDGTSSAYHNNISSPFSIIYGSGSTMERFHAATAADILKKQQFFSLINTTDFWGMFSECIMATDINMYPVYMDHFISVMPIFNCRCPEHRLTFGQYLLVCGNIVNTTRVFQQCQKTVTGLQKELDIMNQKEKELNVTPTPFFAQSKNSMISSIERDFLEQVALPLYRQIGQAVPELNDLSVQIEDNVRKWQKSGQ